LEGEAKIEANKQTEIALRLLRMQVSQADVASTTGLSKADVKRMALEENL
jgi:biotin operon repressor